jgi:hypothetical protein
LGSLFSPKTNGKVSVTFEDECCMLSLLLCLRFCCTGCGERIEATLQCEGRAVSGHEEGGAAIKIVCSGCGIKTEVAFTPDGTIHSVTRARTYERIPEMSVN